MQKKIVLFLLCFCCIFTLFTTFCFADDNEISNSYEYIDASIYQAFVNFLFQNDGEKYSQYINNMHCTVYSLSINKNDWFIDFDYNDLKSVNNNNNYNNFLNGNYNSSYYTYIAFFNSEAFIYREINQNNNGEYYSEQLFLSSFHNMYFAMAMKNNGSIEIYNTREFGNLFFRFNSDCHLIYTDDTINYENSSLDYATPNHGEADLFYFDILENETGSSLYNKLMALYNNEFNVYARLWSSGEKPTVAIFDNSDTNCIIPIINNNEYIQNKYIAVFSTCRLCEYDQNNNSRHFNTLTYGDEILHIITFDEGLNNYTFYNLMNRDHQADVIVLTGITGDEFLFCNSNIIQKSNANDFAVSGNGHYTYYYYSDLEFTSTYPINNNGGSADDNQSIWNDIQNTINSNTVTLSSTFSDIVNDVYNTSSEFVNNTFLPFFRSLFTQISQVMPFDIITDFIEYINSIIQDAKSVKDTIIANHGYNFQFNFLNNNISFNPFYYFFTSNMYNIAYLLCNLSFFTYLIFNIYKHMINILSKN